jgi:hypothetical protein
MIKTMWNIGMWTREAIAKLGQTLLSHPIYSLDVTPSDFHMIAPMKNVVHEQMFTDDDKVIKGVEMWL